MKNRILAVGIAIATITLFALALIASTPTPRSEIYEPARGYREAVLPTLFFLGFIYLHNGRRHVVNVCLTLIFFTYATLLNELQKYLG